MRKIRLVAAGALVAVTLLAAAFPGAGLARTPESPAIGGVGSHEKFTIVLERYVRDGLVNYEGLSSDRRARAALREYVRSLATADTTGQSRNDQLAFWINAYNAITLERVVEAYPVSSITKIKQTLGVLPSKGVWKEPHLVARDTTTLDAIEHQVLRGRFADPRIHFVINCASMSCPPLENRAFVGTDIDARLDVAARRFINDARYNRIPARGGRWQLSKIFEWYADDFIAAAGSVPAYVARYLPAERAHEAATEHITIESLPYDWSLNER